jgi:hypothetical protein
MTRPPRRHYITFRYANVGRAMTAAGHDDDQRRALETLAHQDGCAEAALLADGFSIDQLAGLVVEGYAVMQRRRVDISGRMRTVVWMQITEAGRKAIAE